MVSRGARVWRGWIAASFATSIAAASHALAGGGVPNPLILVFSLAISGLLCLALAGKVLSLTRLSLGVLFSQGLFHLLFSVTTETVTPETAPLVPSAMHHGGMMNSQQMLPPAMPEMDHSSLGMLGAHLVAALLTIVLLRRGEVAMMALLHAIALELRGILRAPLSLPPAPETISAVNTSQLLTLTDLGAPRLTLRHRGPPVSHAFS